MSARAQLLKEIIDRELALVRGLRGSIGANTGSGDLNRLSMTLNSLNHAVREKMQEDTREDIERVIRNLEKDGEVGETDKQLIRTWMIGDAGSYVRTENNFNDWTTELNRLLDEIAAAAGRALAPAQMMDLNAKVRDALRTAADIQFFKEQEERVRNFKEATADWSREDKKVLARLLRAKLNSDEG